MTQMSIEHYEDKASEAVKRAGNAGTDAGAAFFLGAGQIAATLALTYAVQELTEAVRESRS